MLRGPSPQPYCSVNAGPLARPSGPWTSPPNATRHQPGHWLRPRCWDPLVPWLHKGGLCSGSCSRRARGRGKGRGTAAAGRTVPRWPPLCPGSVPRPHTSGATGAQGPPHPRFPLMTPSSFRPLSVGAASRPWGEGEAQAQGESSWLWAEPSFGPGGRAPTSSRGAREVPASVRGQLSDGEGRLSRGKERTLVRVSWLRSRPSLRTHGALDGQNHRDECAWWNGAPPAAWPCQRPRAGAGGGWRVAGVGAVPGRWRPGRGSGESVHL